MWPEHNLQISCPVTLGLTRLLFLEPDVFPAPRQRYIEVSPVVLFWHSNMAAVSWGEVQNNLSVANLKITEQSSSEDC